MLALTAPGPTRRRTRPAHGRSDPRLHHGSSAETQRLADAGVPARRNRRTERSESVLAQRPRRSAEPNGRGIGGSRRTLPPRDKPDPRERRLPRIHRHGRPLDGAIRPRAGCEKVVRDTVREWFEQSLIETVVACRSLEHSQYWSADDVAKLLGPEGLTASVLARYHVDFAVNRSLGRKLGSLKDREFEPDRLVVRAAIVTPSARRSTASRRRDPACRGSISTDNQGVRSCPFPAFLFSASWSGGQR